MLITFTADEYGPLTHQVGSGYDLNNQFDLECVVGECAEHFHAQHDGWEHEWPLDIVIETPRGQRTFTVEMEMEPSFSAGEKKEDHDGNRSDLSTTVVD